MACCAQGGKTPLAVATEKKHEGVILLLKAHGAL